MHRLRLHKVLEAMMDSMRTDALIGTWRRFGLVGPVYEVLGEREVLPGGDKLMRVRVLESGEEVDYKLTAILDDPKEQ